MNVPTSVKTKKELERYKQLLMMGPCATCAMRLIIWQFRNKDDPRLLCSMSRAYHDTADCANHSYELKVQRKN